MKLWIARDKDESLWIFEEKPTFFEGVSSFGCKFGKTYAALDNSWFPEVTFENSPQEVELKLIEK